MPRKKATLFSRLPRPKHQALFVLGLVLFLSFAAYKIHLAVRLSFDQPLPAAVSQNSSPPTNIQIEAIRLNLPIIPTTIQNGTWQVADQGISFLSTGSYPGQSGSIILYGHNTNLRFGPIRWLKLGDEITLTTADNQTHQYQISEIIIVSPSAVDSLLTDQETLILYTCTGFLDKDRYIVKALPSQLDK